MVFRIDYPATAQKARCSSQAKVAQIVSQRSQQVDDILLHKEPCTQMSPSTKKKNVKITKLKLHSPDFRMPLAHHAGGILPPE